MYPSHASRVPGPTPLVWQMVAVPLGPRVQPGPSGPWRAQPRPLVHGRPARRHSPAAARTWQSRRPLQALRGDPTYPCRLCCL